MQIASYLSPVLKKLEFFRRTLVKIPNTKLHETPSSGGLCSLLSEGRTDRQTDRQT